MGDSMDNSFWDVDILGSWIEVGMVLIVVLAGITIAIPSIFGYFRNKKGLINPCAPSYRKQHSRIHEFLTELRVKLSAERSSVIQFHNGGNFLDGSSMKRFSLTHESCMVGTSESMGSRQNLQCTAFVEMLDLLSKEKAVPELTSDLTDGHFKRHLESNHTLIFCMTPLKDARGVLTIGCILTEWCTWDKAEEIDEEKIMVELPQFTRYIEGQLLSGAHGHGQH